MPIQILYPDINGHRYSFSSITFGAAGQPTRGVSSIDYGDELTPGKMRGTGPNVIGRTRGEYDADCEVEMYELEWENLKARLGNPFVGFGETAFPIVVMYADKFQPTITDTLEGCRVTKVRKSPSEGSDPVKVKISIDVNRILHNDVPMFTPPFTGA